MIAHQIIKTVRAGNQVKRWHTRRMIQDETVGEHTANVLALVFALSSDSTPSTALISATLLHDTAEQWTGDIPATAKWSSKALKEAADELEDDKMRENYLTPMIDEITDKEYIILKWADMLDLCYFCLNEMQMGNMQAAEIYQNGVECLHRMEPIPVGVKLLKELEIERNHGRRL